MAVDVMTGERKTVVETGSDAHYASGYLVYAIPNASTDAQGRFRASLRAVRFDLVSASRRSATPVSVFEALMMGSAAAANYQRRGAGRPGVRAAHWHGPSTPPQSRLVWVDRKGQETPIPARAADLCAQPVSSPDGTRIVLDIREQTNDIWIWDINRQTLTTLNPDPAPDMSPIWTPDSQRIIWTIYARRRQPESSLQPADGTGTPQRLTQSACQSVPDVDLPPMATPSSSSDLAAGNVTDIFTVEHQTILAGAESSPDLGGLRIRSGDLTGRKVDRISL